MIYTLDELREKIRPIAEAYALPAVYIFGSYARGEATEDSDVDILVKYTGSNAKGIRFFGMLDDLAASLGKSVDVITLEGINDKEEWKHSPWLIANIKKDRVRLL